jgi:hypothetical protein
VARVVAVLVALVGGVVIGGLTLVLQGLLPGAWNQLANSAAVWSVGGYVAGWALARRGKWWLAALGGLAVLAGEVVGYYASSSLFLPGEETLAALRGPVVWLVIAAVAGPVLGLAGRLRAVGWRRGPRWLSPGAVSAALLGAVFLAEAGRLGLALGYWGEAAILGAIGLAVPLVVGRSWGERGRGLAALVPLVALGLLSVYGGLWLVEAALST